MSLPRPVSPSSSKRRNSSRGKLFGSHSATASTSTVGLKNDLHTTAPRRSVKGGKRPPPRALLLLVVALILCILITLRAKQTPSSTPSHPPSTDPAPNLASGAVNFDFDATTSHLEVPETEEEEDEGEADEEDIVEGGGDAGSDEDTNHVVTPIVRVLHPSMHHLPSRTPTPHPYLPFTCSPCSSISPFSSHPPPTCAKYSGKNPSNATTYHPSILDKSILFPGTGVELKRVLRRATKSHLFSLKRFREGTEGIEKSFEDEESFRILVLGGSVSNCRGVSSAACWHSKVLKWFHKTIPFEADPHYLSPHSDDHSTQIAGPLRLDTDLPLHKRDLVLESDTSELPAETETEVEVDPVETPTASGGLVKRAFSHGKKKKPSHSSKGASKSRRKKPVTRLINLAKSATGSSFFAYCFQAEVKSRKKEKEMATGPDLVVLEFGVNDVWPTNANATRDFEKLLRRLKALPSKPAIIILEAASLLLAQTTSTLQNSEYLHLPAAQFFDVPVLSVKNSLFGGSQPGLKPNSKLKMKDLFLDDKHHPNEVGHELLSDVLIHFLERQMCDIQAEVLQVAGERVEREPGLELLVEPELDLASRRDEEVVDLPSRSVFDPFGAVGGSHLPPAADCMLVGNSKAKVEPKANSGWSRLAWARDKQYLAADKPGSIVTFDVKVGTGGEIFVDWLRSRFYDLGNVLVFLDDDRSSGVSIGGFWDLGWSIGVPTKLFGGVAKGSHTVSFEILPAARSSHPNGKTSFRLIGLITT